MLKTLARGAVSTAARITNKVIPAKTGRFIAESWEAGSHTEKRYGCPVCLSAITHFKPLPKFFWENLAKHGYAHAFFQTETLNTSQYMCPLCGANDRDRLYILYLHLRFKLQKREYVTKFVDFAPNFALSRAIRALPGVDYRSADLYDPKADDIVDITDMPYNDGAVDGFLCSHILEHVPDDRKALKELYRILGPGGFGIIMVPLVDGIEQTIENPLIESKADRWKWYGQDDHVRQYAKGDFVRRIEAAGFVVSQLGEEWFGKDMFAHNGIHPRSVLYVAEKPV